MCKKSSVALRAWIAKSCVAGVVVALVLAAFSSTQAVEPSRSTKPVARRAAAKSPRPSAPPQGGAQGVDFDSLIDLVTSTVAPTTWEEFGGNGSISPYASGVFIDASGKMHRGTQIDLSGRLRQLGLDSAPRPADGAADAHSTSKLRKVSLVRLAHAAQAALAKGQTLDDAMRHLAGLQRVEYVMTLPERGELVLAGPADDWTFDGEGRAVGKQSGRPLLLLDDLVCLWRQARDPGGAFGCLITPRQESLAAAQAWLDAAPASLRPGQRKGWLEQLRSRVGTQDIEVFGIDPQTHAAQTLVEADYRMKLLGLGLEEAPPGLANYLDLLARHGDAAEPLEVVRWWFTLRDGQTVASQDRRVFQLPEQAVQLCSENELLADDGSRIHTHRAAPLNEQFARDFTAQFADIAAHYPIYAELENLCQLALAVTLIEQERLTAQVDWPAELWNDPAAYCLAKGNAPKTVDTVLSSRVVGGRRIIAAVSGGVKIDIGAQLAKQPVTTDAQGDLDGVAGAVALPVDDTRWWWD